MRTTKILLAIAGLAFICSCKKDNAPEPQQPVVPGDSTAKTSDFMHLKPGNYWIYEQYEIDAAGVATTLGIIDSIYAGEETVIEGKTYKVRMDPFSGTYAPSFFRDSGHYLVTPNGSIYASFKDFASTLSTRYLLNAPEDTMAKATTYMSGRDEQTIVPAGAFTTRTRNMTWDIYPAHVQAWISKTQYTRISRQAGIVTETLPFYLSTNSNRERRLIRYHVQ